MRWFQSSIILAATTIGAGMFGLPYIFYKSGFLVGFFYIFIFGFLMILTHYLYAEVILKSNEDSLLEIIQKKLNFKLYFFAFLSITIGLIFTLLVYLILAGQFLNIIFPNISFNLAVFIFWIFASVSLIFEKFFNRFEVLGTFLMTLIILFIFIQSGPSFSVKNIPAYNLNNLFLPFGVILFSLAGWTAVLPMLKYNNYKNDLKSFVFGTILVIILYLFFIFGILNSAQNIAPDALSGLNWSYFKLALIASLGLFAIWTSYLPIGLEIKKSFSKHLPLWLNILIFIFSPIFLFVLGFQNFLKAISLAGGVFLSLQYLFILILERKLLGLHPILKILIRILEIIFILACVYEIYFNILK
jgi:amino acid permease